MPKKHSEWIVEPTSVVFAGVGLPELAPITQTFLTWYAGRKKQPVDQVMREIVEDFAASTFEQLSKEEVMDLLKQLDSLTKENHKLSAHLAKFTRPERRAA